MKLNENPIFLTQKRLVHRGGVLAAILISAIVGLSLLSGLVAYRVNASYYFPDFETAQQAGKTFYGFTIGVEIVLLVLGGFSRISRTLAEERKAGLYDSNRLTPLKPTQIVAGYWLGPALREFYMALVLAGTGLLIVLLAGLPLTFWLGSQLLIFGSALFFGLLAIPAGLGVQRPQIGVLIVLIFFLIQPFSFSFPRFVLTNFLLPSYAIVNLFTDAKDLSRGNSYQDWAGWPSLFGLPIPPILLSLCLQLILGFLLWRGATRKTANPFQPLILRREAVVIFGILLLVQHGLIWSLWRGNFPVPAINGEKYFYVVDTLFPAIQCGTILVACIFLAAASPQPETVRVTALRRPIKSFGEIFSRSAVSLALTLGAISAGVLLLQFARGFTNSWEVYLVTAGNLLSTFLIFALLLEYCRLRHKKRAVGFIVLWLFVLCFLPFILAGVFYSSAFAKLSLLAPGVAALSMGNGETIHYLAWIVFAHFGIAVLLWIVWRREWRQLLAKATASQN